MINPPPNLYINKPPGKINPPFFCYFLKNFTLALDLILMYVEIGKNQKIKGVSKMKTNPWHSIKSDVYHNNSKCTTRNNIERVNIRNGTGNKPLCKECKKLNKQGK